MTRWWFPWVRPPGTSEEAATVSARLDLHAPEVERLAAELRERQATNNFSGMVAAAIARVAAGPR